MAQRKLELLGVTFSPELVSRQCRLKPYTKMDVPRFELEGELIAYASPESTYAVTKQLLDSASTTILIGIYDFTAEYMRDTLIAAVNRGVEVTVMLDLDNRKGEPEVWEQLIEENCICVPAPSCASDQARYFPSCHEKVIVIDGKWTLIQSGNFSDNGIPQNDKDGGDPAHFIPGNRDMGIAVKSEVLATYFTEILRSDIKLELDTFGDELLQPEVVQPLEVELEVARPSQVPPKLFPSKHFRPRRPVAMQPVLSPENYMELIPNLLASATRSIYLEQQYIRAHQPAIQKLLSAICTATERNPGLNIRIVLARPFSDFDREMDNLRILEEFGLTLGTHIRYLNPQHFVHCHNKLIIVDRRLVLVSSQNWSDAAVTKNREAGLLLEYPRLAHYYSAIFNADWRTALRTLAREVEPESIADVNRIAGSERITISLGDYLEV